METDELRDRLRTFAAERDWQQFHTPRNLLLALVGEVGELAELFQWRTDADVTEEGRRSTEAQRVADEVADILIYLVRLADVLGVDLGEATRRKLTMNEKRYPAAVVKGSATKRSHNVDDRSEGSGQALSD